VHLALSWFSYKKIKLWIRKNNLRVNAQLPFHCQPLNRKSKENPAFRDKNQAVNVSAIRWSKTGLNVTAFLFQNYTLKNLSSKFQPHKKNKLVISALMKISNSIKPQLKKVTLLARVFKVKMTVKFYQKAHFFIMMKIRIWSKALSLIYSQLTKIGSKLSLFWRLWYFTRKSVRNMNETLNQLEKKKIHFSHRPKIFFNKTKN